MTQSDYHIKIIVHSQLLLQLWIAEQNNSIEKSSNDEQIIGARIDIKLQARFYLTTSSNLLRLLKTAFIEAIIISVSTPVPQHCFPSGR